MLKGEFKCLTCLSVFEGEGVVKTCPECGNNEVRFLPNGPGEICILPKAWEMAKQLDTEEAYEKAEEVLSNANYHEASAIISEAVEVLKFFIIHRAKNLTTDEISDLTIKAKEIGKLGPALKILSQSWS